MLVEKGLEVWNSLKYSRSLEESKKLSKFGTVSNCCRIQKAVVCRYKKGLEVCLEQSQIVLYRSEAPKHAKCTPK